MRVSAFRDAFFIPSLILATTAAFRRGKALCITLLCCGATLFIARQAKTCESSANARANRDLCRAFVRECAGLIPSGSDVVVAADLDGNTGFYYPLVNLGARVWYRGPEMLTGRTDEEKFNEGLALIASTPERKQELKNFIRKIQRFIPMLPERGFVLFYSDDDVAKIKPMFENHGFKLQPLSRSGSFSLWTFRTFKTAAFGSVIDATAAESPPPNPETSRRCPPFAHCAIVTGTVAEAELPTSSALTSSLSAAKPSDFASCRIMKTFA